MAIFERRTREQRFWDWFGDNSDRLLSFEHDQERVFDQLAKALRKVHDGLTFEFGTVEEGRREFFVSADGVVERFPAVRRLVAAAPTMPQWDVVAFRQPGDIDAEIVMDGQRIGADDLWFVAKPDDELVHIDLFIRGLTDANRELMTGAAFILLDNALGEEVVVERVGTIEFEPVPDEPEVAGLTRFVSIREVFGT